MIFAATGVFTELKDSLNTIWEVQPKPGLGLLQMVRDRFFAFAMVLVIWFLMLISLVTSAAMTALTRFAADYWTGFQVIEAALSLALITVLFALIYRVVPDVKVAWRDVWRGALVTAGLFVIGKSLFGLYLGHSSLGNSYGAAGSLVMDLLLVPDFALRRRNDAGRSATAPRSIGANSRSGTRHRACPRAAGNSANGGY